MKVFINTLCLVLLCTITLLGQVPQSFKYQAVARDAVGNLMADQSMVLRVSLHEGSAEGEEIYSEQQIQTNLFGLFSLKIGAGKSTKGDFSTVVWDKKSIWLSIDLKDSNSGFYRLLSSSELLSVPYALHAASASTLTNGSGSNRTLQDSAWALQGNIGTSATVNFIGTTDFEDLVFRANGTERMRIKAQGEIGIGLISPSTNLEIRGDFRAGDGSNYFQVDPDGDGYFKGTGDYLLGPTDWVWRYQFDEDFGQMYYTNGSTINEYRYMTTIQFMNWMP